MSLLFNQTCLNERLLPNYTYFEIHYPVAPHDTDTQKYRCSLLKRQINNNKEKINNLNTDTCKQPLMMANERSESALD